MPLSHEQAKKWRNRANASGTIFTVIANGLALVEIWHPSAEVLGGLNLVIVAGFLAVFKFITGYDLEQEAAT